MIKKCNFVVIIFILNFNVIYNRCGYQSCNVGKPGILNVHIVSHTHDDAGWLKTVDQYYEGSNEETQKAGVRYILDSVVASLLKDKKRKFSYVEMAFFYMWWNEQSEEVKDDVKMLVNEGRLQFISGGWTMNDEATTHYTAIIDQMSLGLDFLNQTFGKCGLPLVGWQIDPFGHSIEQANLFAEFGFDGWFFTRLHYSDLEERRRTKKMEFIQKTSYFNAKKFKTLFTSILYDTYMSPSGLCFDSACTEAPVVDNLKSAEYNVMFIADNFMNVIQLYAKSYKTNNILLPVGGDFHHHNALHSFLNLDKLIKYTNTEYSNKVFVFHSTPSCYLLAVNQADFYFETNENDFFPYVSEKDKYWTGYFSSRPTVKGFVRKSNNIFQICKKLYALSGLNNKKLTVLVKKMAMEMGIMQHHDAITGTEKQHVTNDYLMRLTKAIDGCETVINASFNKLLSTDKFNYNFQLCTLLNISFCKYTEELDSNEEITMALFNPLGHSVKKWIRLPVVMTNFSSFNVFHSNLDPLNIELIPISNSTFYIPERPNYSESNFELLFQTTVSAMGFSLYKLRKINFQRETKSLENVPNIEFLIENSKIQLHYSNGLLKLIVNKENNLLLPVTQNIGAYYSNDNEIVKGGVYVFLPNQSDYTPFTNKPEIKFYNGNLVKEIHQIFQENVTLITRLYEDSDLIETEWTVGTLSFYGSGVNVVIHFDIDFNNSDTFYTDSNGRQLIKRTIVKNEFTKANANFYPIDASAILFDVNNEIGFLIHTDRAQGGGATATGHFELMVHRRIYNDDKSGVGEELNEIGSDGGGLIARGRHWFTINFVEKIFKRRQHDALEIFNQPEILFSKSSQYLNVDNSTLSHYSGINLNAIPKGLHILSFENHITNNNEVDYKILRLENILHTNTPPIKVDIKSILKNFKILSFEELNLSTNELLKNISRLKWNEYAKEKSIADYLEPVPPDSEGIIFIKPEQIRTFRLYN